ncbi:hypothetical protein EKO27_g9077 [Xylaria grammica]|uniref:Uncharacterized protein n=1 Tax=Xylaria grammica TaxID=363999 RepID=A0A439CV50_9PEZI|nr:hypothetical protein EKO27_g9077 [Xylaria grammica]
MRTRLKLVGSALLALVAGECTNFELAAEDHDSYVHLTNPYNLNRDVFRVSALVDCTSEIAQSEGGADSTTCGFHRYSMGLITHPRFENWTYVARNNVSIEYLEFETATTAHIFSLVQAANPPNITSADFNATIVMNFTTTPETEPDIPHDQSGLYVYWPSFICWNGTLSGCNPGDALEGARIQACGLQWLDDAQRFLPTGQQKYKGASHFIRATAKELPNLLPDPSPTYDESAGNATVNQNATTNQMGSDDDESSGWVKDVSFLTLIVPPATQR